PEFSDYANENIEKGWVQMVTRMKDILRRGVEAYEQINILGDDAVPVDYHVKHWKSELLDFIILQQDAFDQVDQNTPIQRQKYMLKKVLEICDFDFEFEGYEEVSLVFKKLINIFKQMNYSGFNSD